MTQSDLCLYEAALAAFWRRHRMGDRVDTVENLRAFEVIQGKDDGHLDCSAGGGGGSGHGLDMERMEGGIKNDT